MRREVEGKDKERGGGQRQGHKGGGCGSEVEEGEDERRRAREVEGRRRWRETRMRTLLNNWIHRRQVLQQGNCF
jgi:hypothetical protein